MRVWGCAFGERALHGCRISIHACSSSLATGTHFRQHNSWVISVARSVGAVPGVLPEEPGAGLRLKRVVVVQILMYYTLWRFLHSW